MKTNKLLKLCLLSLASILASCGGTTSSITPSTGNSENPITTTNTPTTTTTPTTNTPTTSTSSTPDEYTKVTVSDFLKYKETNKYYILEGTITNLTDNRYGNFDLKDSTGSVFCYGVLENKGATDKKWFQNSGLKEGDTIVLAGRYLNYNGKDEIVDAYYISSTSSSGGNSGSSSDYAYTDFTTSEKSFLNSTIGFVIPFAPCDEYYLEDYIDDYGVINYYALDMTQQDFNNYKALWDKNYTYGGTDDYFGDTLYLYSYNGIEMDISYYNYDFGGYSSWIIDVYIYVDSIGGSGSGDNNGSTDGTLHTDFTASEKSFLSSTVGFVIPFAPAYEYYLDDYIDDYGLINYYAIDQTTQDFNNYKAKWDNQYEYLGIDEYEGITLYVYSYKGIEMDISYYECEFMDGSTGWIIDVYIYVDSTGSSGSNGGASPSQPDGLVTNEGKGLPTGTNGIYNVDFTKASPLKDVHDQGYYLDGCPTVGDVNVLVIPVEFSDSTASSKGYTLDTLEKAFNGTSTSNSQYPSVKEFYYDSSYGKLNLNFDILDSWFKPSQPSTYYINLDKKNDGSDPVTSEQYILEEALTKLDTSINFSDYDLDNNGSIDAVVMINTLDIDYDVDLQWAFRYWNLYTDNNGYYYDHDDCFANDYLWASYQFLFENGSDFNSKTPNNTYTFIHEFGHILGSDDYYDTSYADDGTSGLRGYDLMDSEFADHNPYTKFNYGWITSSRLVTTTSSITIDLEDFSKNGDTIILANNFDPEMGVYQEYYVLMYYTNNGINSNSNLGLFEEEGILMYHVNASYYVEEYYGETYYDVYNNNTLEGDYASEDMLIEFITNGNDIVYGVNDSSSKNIVDDNGNTLAYSFKVNSLNGTSANLTITRN